MRPEASNPFGEVQNVINNPVTQFGLSQINNYIHIDRYSGLLNKVFTPEIRSYFDVNTELVRRKILKILAPFKTFEWDDEVKKL